MILHAKCSKCGREFTVEHHGECELATAIRIAALVGCNKHKPEKKQPPKREYRPTTNDP